MRKAKTKRTLKIVLLVFFGLLVILRLCLPAIAKHYVNQELNQDPLYRGHVDDVKIHLWRGAYSAIGLELSRVKGQRAFPLVAADEIDVGISWKELLHAAVRMKLEITNLVVNIVQEAEDGEKKVAIGQASKEGKKQEAQDWKTTFRNLVPIDVGRLTVNGGSIHYRDLTSKPEVDVFLDQLAIEGRNLTNSEKMSQSLFGSVDVNARAMESGKLQIAIQLNPLEAPPEFKVTTRLDGLELKSLNNFFGAYGKFDVKSGTLGIYSEMATADNRLKGYVKPILKDLSVSDLSKDTKKGGVIHAAWEVVVGAIGGIFKNHAKGQQAARITFEGRLDDPKTNGWEIAKSVFYNMFVKPISPRIENSVKIEDLKKPGSSPD